MIKQFFSDKHLPIDIDKLNKLRALIDNFSPLQIAWFSGYLWSLVINGNVDKVSDLKLNEVSDLHSEYLITILSASQTGNARRLGEELYEYCVNSNLNVTLVNASEYKFKKISQEQFLVIIVSTQGEGEPPEEAFELYEYLLSKKAPKMSKTYFSVFGLGDSSYEFFAKIGKDFDSRLEELGAVRLLNRVDADVDYHNIFSHWKDDVVNVLKNHPLIINGLHNVANDNVFGNNVNNCVIYTENEPIIARLSLRQKITSRFSSKDIHHLEFDIKDAGFCYQPGDAVGVWYENDSLLVNELLVLFGLDENEIVQVKNRSLPLKEALRKYCDLTNNTPMVVERYSVLTGDINLITLVTDKVKLREFSVCTPLIKMVRCFPVKLTSQQLLSFLNPLVPRLYSVASSQAEVGEEVHISVSVVRYELDGVRYTGGASGYLVDRLREDDSVRLFFERNNNFRLPSDSSIPIIMISAGTGVAPFRAFMQQRSAESASGKNWLFFGNPKFVNDFLYQVEWQEYFKNGVLTKINTAWSQDNIEKIYVQDKLLEEGEEVWRWISDGAYIYVCGDAKRMADGVHQKLINLIAKYGSMSLEDANVFLKKLRITRRYQRDVY